MPKLSEGYTIEKLGDVETMSKFEDSLNEISEAILKVKLKHKLSNKDIIGILDIIKTDLT